jgi:hypothetical protein
MYAKQELMQKAEARCGLGQGLVLESYPERLWQELRKDMTNTLLFRLSTGEIFYGDYGGASMLRGQLNDRAMISSENSVIAIRYDNDPFWDRPTPQRFEKTVQLTLLDRAVKLSVVTTIGNANHIDFLFTRDRCILDVSTIQVLQIPTYSLCVDPVRDVALSLRVFSHTLSSLLKHTVLRARELLYQHAKVYLFEDGRYGILAPDFHEACCNHMGSTSHHILGENASGPHDVDPVYREKLQAHYSQLVHPHLRVDKILHTLFQKAHVDDFLRTTQLSVETLLP